MGGIRPASGSVRCSSFFVSRTSAGPFFRSSMRSYSRWQRNSPEGCRQRVMRVVHEPCALERSAPGGRAEQAPHPCKQLFGTEIVLVALLHNLLLCLKQFAQELSSER